MKVPCQVVDRCGRQFVRRAIRLVVAIEIAGTALLERKRDAVEETVDARFVDGQRKGREAAGFGNLDFEHCAQAGDAGEPMPVGALDFGRLAALLRDDFDRQARGDGVAVIDQRCRRGERRLHIHRIDDEEDPQYGLHVRVDDLDEVDAGERQRHLSAEQGLAVGHQNVTSSLRMAEVPVCRMR